MTRKKRIISIAAAAVIAAASVGIAFTQPPVQAKASETIFPSDFKGWYALPENSGSAAVGLDSPAELAPGVTNSFTVDVPEDGDYILALTYRSESDIVLKSTLTAELAGQSCMTQVTSVWRDEDETYPTDSYGNELPAGQITIQQDITDIVRDQSGVSSRPFVFKLKKGVAQLSLTSNDAPLLIKGAVLIPHTDTADAEEYLKSISGRKDSTDTYIIEAEKSSFKSDSSIRAASVRNPALSPYDYSLKKCNVLDAASFNTAGQKVQYVFDVETSGIYNISFRYSQDYKEDIPVYSNILIDSRILCEEFESVPFTYTGSDYQNTTVSGPDGAIGVYLEAGRHTITLESDGTPVADIISRLSDILSGLSSLGVEIKKISGGEASEYRTWEISDYLPGLVETLTDYRDELNEIYAELGTLQTENPAAGLNTKLAADNLTKLLNNENKIPGNLQLLNEGSGSATQFLADQIDKLTYQNLSLDRIYIHSPSYELPAASASVFTNLSCGVKQLLGALFGDETKEDAGDQNMPVLDIWVNRSIQYVDTLQALADSQFTEKYGVKVEFSVMSSEQKVLLANASDSAPDVIMGVTSDTPFNLGIRGAVVDLTEFDDFADYITQEYNTETLVPYVLGDSIYGVTETLEFYVLMMRTDIMNRLGITAPKTWNDVAELMPVLRRNSMNFYLQLSGYTGTKPIYTTIPFIMQSGGSIYSDDGLSTAMQSASAYEGFKTLTDLYRLYSVQNTVSSFYNSFRYGQIPIGIASFSDYVKIKNAAPEITGLWEISTAPGFEDEDGVIHNGTTGVSTAAAIMSASEYKEEAWTFLKWWLSSEVQAEYGNTMQMTYGSDYLWNTANITAFEKLTFPEEDKEVILAQWEQMTEIYRHPALYAVERELSNAWSDVVIDGQPARIAIDNAASEINREFKRKLQEFGYIDSSGNTLKTFSYRSVDDILGKGSAE